MSVAAKENVHTEPARTTMDTDLKTIDSSLQYINELLRNTLDWHRAASQQMVLDMAPTDLLRDVLQPVSAVLFLRGQSKVTMYVECPPDLIVVTDRLRLKQVILNLAANSNKFVTEGFIRLRALLVNGHVQLYVEDSGPGIPVEKQRCLFEKFQESLDLLNQGTGIGLSLCKHIVDLMEGDIYLDEMFNSGHKDCPGTRFVIDLKIPPTQMDHKSDVARNGQQHSTGIKATHQEQLNQSMKPSQTFTLEDGSTEVPRKPLPETMSVLFVDDDMMLRKLFVRSVCRVSPNWTIQEASSGETALHLIETESYDIIFLDQYMSSVEKQLLGTEAARQLRARGFRGRICGLSANDMESQFLQAGADNFLLKPFPCEKELLRKTLQHIWYGAESSDDHN